MAAVAERPLEAPRQLPAALHAKASAISGRDRPPLFTSGPATRNALAAAGALGATTGTVVHLPSPPVMSQVLAHELMHTRSPVRRPRFFLGKAGGIGGTGATGATGGTGGSSGLLDDDERQALDAGRQAIGRQGAGIVDRLPVGGGIGAVSGVADRAAQAAVMQAAPAGQVVSGGQSASARTDPNADTAGNQATTPQAAAMRAPAPQGTQNHAVDPDRIVEIVEARLLREIERRGGRWAGMF